MNRLFEVRVSKDSCGGFDAYVPAIDMTAAGSSLQDALCAAADLINTAAPLFLQENKPFFSERFDFDNTEGVFGVLVDCSADTPEVDTMTVREVADLLDVSVARVHAMIRSGILEAKKVGNLQMVSTESARKRANAPRKAGRPRKNGQAEKAALV